MNEHGNLAKILRKSAPWLLLLPALLLLIGIFAVAMVKFLNYSTYGFDQGVIVYERSTANFLRFLTDRYVLGVLKNTLLLGLQTVILAFLIGYPLAYAGVRLKSKRFRTVILLFVFLPLVTSVVVRCYGWFIILSTKGVINWIIQTLGLSSGPLDLVYTKGAVLLGNVHVLLPFMVFPILSSLSGLNPAYKEAAYDLGTNKLQRFTRVTFPLSLSGTLSGIEVVFTLSISSYVTPVLLGGGKVMVLSRMIYEDTIGMNWPMAAAAGAVMLLCVFAILLVFNKLEYLVRTE